MTVKVVGTHAPLNRVLTGLYTLDHALINNRGDLGVVTGVGYEIFGSTGIGKSTFTYSLAGLLARLTQGDISLSDLEGFDPDFLVQILTACAFDGKIYILSDPEDENQLDELVTHLDKKSTVGIVDSVGAISPISESEGEIGEANMGRRGFIMAQFSRKAIKVLRFKKDRTVLMINHWVPRLGSRGYTTPGGETLKYLATVRIKLERAKVDAGKTIFPDGSYVLEGTVIKNRWGYSGRTFSVFMLAGVGLHPGMTALWDCIALKIIKRTKSGLMYGKENLGKLGVFATQAKRGEGDFSAFYKLLEEYNGNTEEPTDDSEPDGDGTAEPDGETSEVLED